MDEYIQSRRDLLKRTGLLAAGMLTFPLWMPRVALASPDSPTQGDILVCVFMRGACDGLNLVVPYGDSGYYAQRSALAIPPPKSSDPQTSIDLDGFFGLHPNLRPLKDIYDGHAFAIVHAVGSPDPTHSHFDAMDFMERGTPGEKAIPTGWIGRHLQEVASSNDSPFRAVGMGPVVQASLRGPLQATSLQSIADFHLNGNPTQVALVQNTLASLYEGDGFVASEGQQTLRAMKDLAKLAQGSYTPAHGAQYPQTAFGKSLSVVAQLIKFDMGLEVACVDIGGWDTHVLQGAVGDGQMPRLISEFAGGLAAFYADTQETMKGIVVVTMSEFGRRVHENASRGTDHGHGNVMFVMGGGINGGKVYGDWPGLSKDKLYGPGDLAITTDFRDILGEIVQKRLQGTNLGAVFPGYESFKFRGLAQGNGPAAATPATAPAIELPFGSPLPSGK